jgi:hypothetical protein
VASGNPRWVEVSDSQYAHEREGLAYIKTHLPVAPPYRAWTNFEFMDEQGRWHEVGPRTRMPTAASHWTDPTETWCGAS